jgi:hypothetical protein
MRESGGDRMLRELLGQCGADQLAHQEALASLLREAYPRAPLAPSEGMRGLVRDVVRGLRVAARAGGESLDLAILSQYQRLSRHHLSRVGTAAAYAEGLRMATHVATLANIMIDISNGESEAKRLALEREAAEASPRD